MSYSVILQLPNLQYYTIAEDATITNTKTGKVLKSRVNKQGYHRVTLINGKDRFHFYVHRLVALTFQECPGEGYEVHHKDEDRSNNHNSNLKWVTRAENMAYVHAGWLNRKWAKKAMLVQPLEARDYSGDFVDPVNDDLPF